MDAGLDHILHLASVVDPVTPNADNKSRSKTCSYCESFDRILNENMLPIAYEVKVLEVASLLVTRTLGYVHQGLRV